MSCKYRLFNTNNIAESRYTGRMLMCYRFVNETSICIGIAVNQWIIEGEPRIYVLLPQDAKKYCEVDIVYPHEFEWCLFDSDNAKFVFDSRELKKDEILSFDEAIEQDLYYVWDDGAAKHPKRAKRIYDYFKPIIEQYGETALSTKRSYFEQEYQEQLNEAKDKGWDTELVSRKVPFQAYDFY